MEDSSQLFYQAATLMLVGMGFVYVFLTILIVIIKTVISPLALAFPDQAPATKQNRATNNVQNENVVAVISAAISQYRKAHNKTSIE